MNREDAEILDLIERGYDDQAILALYPHLTPEALHWLTSQEPAPAPRRGPPARKATRKGRRVVLTALQAALVPAVLLILGSGFLSTMKGIGQAGGGSFVRAEVITKYAVSQPDGAPRYVVRTALGDTSVKPGVYADVRVRRPVCLQLVRDRRGGGASRMVGVVPDDLCT
ncbi:hypothetical protein [Deinococcus petrolearius]|uniref:Uncharacterized protein n=1 Tax=Deinococcus petrolearius TaxID=1751295 RepID=A0ABW1DNC4_9DEIO